MALELTKTTTNTDRGSGRSTRQVGAARENSATTTSTPGVVETESTDTKVTDEVIVQGSSTRTSAGDTAITYEDASLVLSFTIPFQNDEPVPPPGESSPSAC